MDATLYTTAEAVINAVEMALPGDVVENAVVALVKELGGNSEIIKHHTSPFAVAAYLGALVARRVANPS